MAKSNFIVKDETDLIEKRSAGDLSGSPFSAERTYSATARNFGKTDKHEVWIRLWDIDSGTTNDYAVASYLPINGGQNTINFSQNVRASKFQWFWTNEGDIFVTSSQPFPSPHGGVWSSVSIRWSLVGSDEHVSTGGGGG